MRFTTGSSVCLSSQITVMHNTSSGFCRSPVGHTCSSLLDLPVSYLSYREFVSDYAHSVATRKRVEDEL